MNTPRPPAWTAGFNAWYAEGEEAVNPYDEGSRSYVQWNAGYTHAKGYDSTPSGITRKVVHKNPYLDTDIPVDTEDDYLFPSNLFWYKS